MPALIFSFGCGPCSPARRADRQIDVRLVSFRDNSDVFAGSGVERFTSFAGYRIKPLGVDEELAGLNFKGGSIRGAVTTDIHPLCNTHKLDFKRGQTL